MSKTIKCVITAALLSLGACATPPAISDIATDKVKVQSSRENLQGATAEANSGCGLYKRVPVYLSYRIIPTGAYSAVYEYLFACMTPGSANVSVER
jgi:hypothetical protein